ncbi:hypothetical protein FQR65_LT08925 [Abscondita terminalis]|nr:hypothetical protein FQR65_LT08925 [Abscondita terminalis]
MSRTCYALKNKISTAILILWWTKFTFGGIQTESKFVSIKSCLGHIITSLFRENETLCFINVDDEIDIVDTVKNPYFVVNLTQDIKKPSTYNFYSNNFILYHTTNNIIIFFLRLLNSVFWSWLNVFNSKFIIVTHENDVNNLFKECWKKGFINIVVIRYWSYEDVDVLTANPQDYENECGNKFVKFRKHRCFSQNTITFPKIFRKYSNCNVTLLNDGAKRVYSIVSTLFDKTMAILNATREFNGNVEKPYDLFSFKKANFLVSPKVPNSDIVERDDTVPTTTFTSASPDRTLVDKMSQLSLTIILWCVKFVFTSVQISTESAPFKECLVDVIQNLYKKNETLGFINMEDEINLFEITSNPYITINLSKTVAKTINYKNYNTNFIAHLKSHSFHTLFWNIKDSVLWDPLSIFNGKLIIVTPKKHIDTIFKECWAVGFINLVVIRYCDDTESCAVRITTANPQDYENNCGSKVLVTREETCSQKNTIQFPQLLRKYTNCNVSIVFELAYSNQNFKSKTVLSLFMTAMNFLNANVTITKTPNPAYPFVFKEMFLGANPNLSSSCIVSRDDVVWVVPTRKTIPSIEVLKIIFKVDLWIAVPLAYVLTSVVWYLLVKYFTNVSDTFTSTLMIMWSITLFGSAERVPGSLAMKFVFIAYVVYSVHIQTAFTSNLVDILTVTQYEKGITNLDELANSDITIFMANTSLYRQSFSNRNTTNEMYNKIKEKIVFVDDMLSVVRGTNDNYSFVFKADIIDGSTHPYVILNLMENITKFKSYMNYKPVFIVHLTLNDVHKLILELYRSVLWNPLTTFKATFIIITNYQMVPVLFQEYWYMGIVNLVVISYGKTQYIRVHTSNPEAPENQCGTKALYVFDQPCSTTIRIEFPKIFRKFTNCNITLTGASLVNTPLLKSEGVKNIVRSITEHLNASLTISETSMQMHKFLLVLSTMDDFRIQLQSSVVDYDDFVWVVPAPKKLHPIVVLKIVFKENVWFAILLSYFVTSIIWWSMMKLTSTTTKFSSVLMTLYSMTLFGFSQNPPSRLALKFIFIGYIVYSLHIQTAFICNLIKILTIPQFEKPLATLEQLANSNITIFISEAYYDRYFVHDSIHDDLYSKIRKKLVICNMEKFRKVLFAKETYSKFSYFYKQDEIELLQTSLNMKIYKIVDNSITTSYKTTIVMPSYSYFSETLYKLINIFVETGLHDHFVKKIAFSQQILALFRIKKVFKINVVLNLEHLMFPFLFWIIGVLIAMIVFVGEILTKEQLSKLDNFGFLLSKFDSHKLQSFIIYYDDYVWVVPSPKKLHPIEVLKIVFKTNVWIAILLSYFLTSIIWWLILRRASDSTNFSSALIALYSLTLFGSLQRPPSFLTLKLIFVGYVVYSVHIQTAFTCNLINILTIPQFEHPITTLEELANTNVPIFIEVSDYYYHFRNESVTENLYSRIRNKLKVMSGENFTKLVFDKKVYSKYSYLFKREEIEIFESFLGTKIYKVVDNTITSSHKSIIATTHNSYFAETLFYLISVLVESATTERDQLKICFDNIIRNNFDPQEIVYFFKMGNDNTTFVDGTNHPYIIVDLMKSVTKFKNYMDYKPIIVTDLRLTYPIHFFQAFAHSKLWSAFSSVKATYIIFTKSPTVSPLFAYCWQMGIVNLVIISYSKYQHNYNIRVYTGDPQTAENWCEEKAVIISEQKCSSTIRIRLPKTLRKFPNCKIIFGRSSHHDFLLLKSHSVNFMIGEIVKYLNASLIIVKNKGLTHKFSLMLTSFDDYVHGRQSQVVLYDDFVWVVPAPKKLYPIEVLKIVFKNNVWLSILVAYWIISIFWWLVLKLSSSNSDFSSVLLTVYSLTLFGSSHQTPSILGLKFIFIFYIVYSIHIQTGFTCNLINILTVPQFEKQINTLEELLKSNLSVIIDHSLYEKYFSQKSDHDDLYSKIRKKMVNYSAQNFKKFIYDNETYTKYSYFHIRDEVESLQVFLNTTIYKFVDNSITNSRKISIVLPFFSYFAETLFDLINIFIDTGLHDHLINEIAFFQKLSMVSSFKASDEDNVVLNLEHLTFPFVFWIVGLILAMFVFIAEIKYMSKTQKNYVIRMYKLQ